MKRSLTDIVGGMTEELRETMRSIGIDLESEPASGMSSTVDIPSADIHALRVDIDRGNVLIDRWDQAAIRVVGDGTGEVTVAHEGDVLAVSLEGAANWMRWLRGGGLVTVHVPQTMRLADIVASTKVGDVSVIGAIGQAALKSGMGDLRIVDCEATISARTGAGSVDMTNCAGKIDLSSGIGGMHLTRCRGQITAHTGSGGLSVRDCHINGDMHSGQGDILLQGVTPYPETKTQGGLSLRTGAGMVALDTVHGGVYSIRSGAGDIRLTDGWVQSLSAHTGVGSMRCQVSVRGDRCELRSGSGDVELWLATPRSTRVEARTGMGRVRSDFPLVRVSSRGPESMSGNRFVGTIGQGEVVYVVNLRTGMGDIWLRQHPADGESRDDPTPTTSPATVSDTAQTTAPAPLPGSSQADVTPESVSTSVAPPAQVDDSSGQNRVAAAPAQSTTPPETLRLAILQRLQAGQISVEEALALLEHLN